jgi:hypothetical protein
LAPRLPSQMSPSSSLSARPMKVRAQLPVPKSSWQAFPFPSGRFLEQQARVGPRPWSRTRKQLRVGSFVLTTWSSCGGPRRSAASELAVVPSPTPGSWTRNAWPARLRPATSRHRLRPTSLRAVDRVPSGVVVRADRLEPPRPPLVAPSSRSIVALISRSVPGSGDKVECAREHAGVDLLPSCQSRKGKTGRHRAAPLRSWPVGRRSGRVARSPILRPGHRSSYGRPPTSV